MQDAPFFTVKLQVKMLPCLIFFQSGVACDRAVGFDDYGATDDFTTSAVERRLLKSGMFSTCSICIDVMQALMRLCNFPRINPFCLNAYHCLMQALCMHPRGIKKKMTTICLSMCGIPCAKALKGYPQMKTQILIDSLLVQCQ